MIKAEIVVDFPKWKTKIKNPSLYFKKKIKKLNKRFRKKNKETDVLSFPIKSHFNKNYKGDIAICYEIINLRSKKTNFNIEFDKMWIHGLLHLLGYNHVRQKDYKQMLRKEQDILKRVN